MSFIAIAAGTAAATGLGTAIYGGVKAGKERKAAAKERGKMQDYLTGQEVENKDWYSANINTDYTQRADAQYLMKMTRDALKKNNEVAANSAVVTGATPEAAAVAKEQSNKTIADTTSKIGAMGQQWKDGITDKYLARKNSLSGAKYGGMAASEQNMQQNAMGYDVLMANGVKQIGSAAGSYAGGLLDPTSKTGVDQATLNATKFNVNNFTPSTVK